MNGMEERKKEGEQKEGIQAVAVAMAVAVKSNVNTHTLP